MGSALNTDKKINAVFSEIINKTNWIIEDNGTRQCFEKAFDAADSIILLYPNKYTRLKRIIFRYIKQKLKLEECNYQPTMRLVKSMINGSEMFERGDDGLKRRLSELENKAITLKSKSEVNAYIKNRLYTTISNPSYDSLYYKLLANETNNAANLIK